MLDALAKIRNEALRSGAVIDRWIMPPDYWRSVLADTASTMAVPSEKKGRTLFGLPVIIDPRQHPQLITMKGANEVSLKVPL